MARAMRIIRPPAGVHITAASGKAARRFSEDIPPAQRVEVRRKSRSFPDGARDNVDHLFDHLSVRVYGVPCWSTYLPESANRLSTAVNGGPWETTGTNVRWLRIRRPQVRVLPSVLLEFLYLQEFFF
ncbi:MAG: hypothetical protein K0S10_2484 [Rubrobacteraceae bacterium]|jgi:hypothetical protein|nr:hypothetical protein [Rubrobacteraceae bacterium]